MQNPNSRRNLSLANSVKKSCSFCGISRTLANLSKHEKSCVKNPSNHKPCPVCSTMFAGKSVTCSYSCSNRHFASVRNKPERYKSYRTICFKHHEKKCIVCAETNIVEVHHLDGNNKNNDPKNLIPLCPTHHKYVHSRYKDQVFPIIQSYICA